MQHDAGLDVSRKETALCVIDARPNCLGGRGSLQIRCMSHGVRQTGRHTVRTGLETGATARWLLHKLKRRIDLPARSRRAS
jgi:hypothetical protein